MVDGRVTLTPALDPMNTQYSLKQSSKSFFHFTLQASSEVDLPVVIRRMKILEYFASVPLPSVRMNNSSSIIGSVWVTSKRKDGRR